MSKTKSFLSIFKNGGPNYSFGRTFSGLVVFVCLTVLTLAVYSDYNRPTKSVLMSRFDLPSKTQYQESVLVAEPNWPGYQSFMLGIAALAGAIYGITKGGEAITKRGDNNQDPQPPQVPNIPGQ